MDAVHTDKTKEFFYEHILQAVDRRDQCIDIEFHREEIHQFFLPDLDRYLEKAPFLFSVMMMMIRDTCACDYSSPALDRCRLSAKTRFGSICSLNSSYNIFTHLSLSLSFLSSLQFISLAVTYRLLCQQNFTSVSLLAFSHLLDSCLYYTYYKCVRQSMCTRNNQREREFVVTLSII